MTVKINGYDCLLAEGISLRDCLFSRGYQLSKVVVEHNGVIVQAQQWEIVFIKDNDRLEVVSFVGGG